MRGRKSAVCCLIALSLLVVSEASGIGTPEDQSEDIFTLGEVVVSGKLAGIEGAQTVQEITSEQISKTSARTLDEALVLLSNVNIQVGGEGVPRVDIRGFRTRHVLLLLDGIPMNSAFDQQFDPSTIPVENIAKIKVTAGASSVLYGQGGLGGVINIITKKGTKGVSAKAGFESGDGQPYYVRTSLSGGKGKFDYFLSGSVFRRDNFPLARDFTSTLEEAQGYRKNSDSTRDNAFFNVGFTPNNDLYIALTGNWVQGGYGKPASAIDSRFDRYAPQARFGRVDWYGGYTLQLAADYSASTALNIRSMVYYNRMDQDDNQYDDDQYRSIVKLGPDGNMILAWTNPQTGAKGYEAVNPNVSNSYTIRNRGITRGASFQPKYDLGKAGSITFGASAEWDTWTDAGWQKSSNGNFFDSSGNSNSNGGGGSPPYYLFQRSHQKDLYIASAAMEYEVSPIKNLGLAVGVGHHWQFRDEKNESGYSVSASTYYDMLKNTRLKLAFQRNIRFPSLSQLYKPDSANPFLEPETVYHYQVGIEQKLPWRTVFKLDGYRSDLHNVIILDQAYSPPRNRNFSLYRFTGVDTSLESNPYRTLQFKVSYTLVDSKDRSGVDRDEVQYVPKHKVTAVGKYDFDCGFTPFVSVIYVSDSFVYSKQRIATVSKAQLANYYLVNVKLSQKLYKDKLLMYIGADNIFNKDYEQSYGIPRPGRFIFGGIEYRFSI